MRQNRSRLTMLAGWLFADLFLVLLVAGLAVLPGGATPQPIPVTPSPRPVGLDPNHVDITIDLSPNAYRAGGADTLLGLVNAALGQRNPGNRQVGFVLVFASDDAGHVQRANDTATDVYGMLRARSPVFANASGLGYWNGNHNNFDFKVFMLN
ncbi:hypothetical protein ACWEGE_39130 [Amycolatopsis sp. NPDC004747]